MTETIAPELKIEMVPIGDCRPYWRNPRNNAAAIGPTRASIEKYGWQQPLVIDQDGVIIVGHTRYRAAKQMKLTHVPCVRATLSPEKAKEYRIADNKTSDFSTWDTTALVQELRTMADADMAVFFGGPDPLEALLKGLDTAAPTQADIDRAAGKRVVQFTVTPKGMVEVVCPNCAHEWKFNRAELDRQPDAKP